MLLRSGQITTLWGKTFAAPSHSHQISHADVDPGDPGGPEGGVEGRAAVGQADVPAAVFQGAADDVGLAVAVEVADLNIDPGGGGAPARPLAGSEGSSGAQAGPPGAALQPAAGDVHP